MCPRAVCTQKPIAPDDGVPAWWRPRVMRADPLIRSTVAAVGVAAVASYEYAYDPVRVSRLRGCPSGPADPGPPSRLLC
jgi:hypothetical protein